MFGYLPLSLWLFKKLSPQRAVIAVFALGWMFLPQYSFDLPGIPDYTKISAIAYSILLGTWLYNRKVLSDFKPHVVDLPIVVWCITPFFTSVSNDLGAYDGSSELLNTSVKWGLPYFIGRLYFNNRQALTELAFGIFIAGLIYMPLCLIEVKMSPQLHNAVYGFHAHDFIQAKRGGGFRPVVFMEHGLMVAMWMVMAFLSGFQLYRSGWLGEQFPKYRKHWKYALLALFVTIILNKSAGALALILLAIAALRILHATRSMLPILALVLVPVIYVVARGGGFWDGKELIQAAGGVASDDRSASLTYRLWNENILMEKAKLHFYLGWGKYQRSFVFNEEGKAISVPDGFWILTFGQFGVVGLTAVGILLTLPPLLFLHRFPPREWREPAVNAIVAQPLIIALFTIDSLFNAMFNPLVLLLSGGISCMWINRRRDALAALRAGSAPSPGTVRPRPAGTRLF